ARTDITRAAIAFTTGGPSGALVNGRRIGRLTRRPSRNRRVIPAQAYRRSKGERAMAYGHAERNLALIRQLEAETGNLLPSLDEPDPAQPAWCQELTSPSKQAVHQHRPETAAASSF